MRVCTGKLDATLPVIWAIGALADGDTEILGTWSRLDEGRPSWTVAAAELRRRGVERIRFLITEDADALTADLPGKPAIVSRSACTLDSLSSLGLAAGHRRIVERTTLLADSINAKIVRRLNRLASFGSAADAMDLVVRSLSHAQRRIETSAKVPYGAPQRIAVRLAPPAVVNQCRLMSLPARGIAG
jgi:transposase-like protein